MSKLKEIRKALCITQEHLGEKLRSSRAVIAQIEIGHSKCTEKHLEILFLDLNVNPSWFFRGEGEMFNSQNTVVCRPLLEKPEHIHIAIGNDDAVNACMVEAIALLEAWTKIGKAKLQKMLSIDDAIWNAVVNHTVMKIEPSGIKVKAEIEIPGYHTYYILKS